MILPDVNLLVYAYNTDAPAHREARQWWEDSLSGRVHVGLAWAVMFGYIRIMTSRRVLPHPFRPREALGHVQAWIDRPNVAVVSPGPRHLAIVLAVMESSGAVGAATTDVHLAALAIELQAELHSNDGDFGRFAGLRWRNPIT